MRRRARGCQCGQWNRPIRQTGLPAGERDRPRRHSKVHRLPPRLGSGNRLARRQGTPVSRDLWHPCAGTQCSGAFSARVAVASLPRSRGSCLSGVHWPTARGVLSSYFSLLRAQMLRKAATGASAALLLPLLSKRRLKGRTHPSPAYGTSPQERERPFVSSPWREVRPHAFRYTCAPCSRNSFDFSAMPSSSAAASSTPCSAA